MQLRRPRFVIRVGISGCCLFRRILWMEHLAFEAMSLFPNPLCSKALIRTCVAASSGGAIIVDDTLTLARWKMVEGGRSGRSSPVLAPLRYFPVQAAQATGLPRSPLKELFIKFSDTQFAFYYTY